MSPAENYLAHLDAIFQAEPKFYRNNSLVDGIKGVTAIVYENIPEPGMVTGLTYGLSLYPHPEWKFSRPELCISVQSTELAWGRVAGFLANQGRGKTAFCYGDTINFRAQIADDSQMNAFLVFAPSVLNREDYLNVDIGADYKVSIAGLYPIYSSEIEVCHRLGLESFWHHPGFDLYDVKRPAIT